MRNVRSFDIVAVLRAPLENYPPSLNQVQLFAERGYRLIVVDLYPNDAVAHGLWTHPNVKRIRLKALRINSNVFQRFAAAVKFFCVVRWIINIKRPSVVISYDPYAMIASGLPNAFNVWHFHELFVHKEPGGFLTRRAIRFAQKKARFADLLIFPDENRRLAFFELINCNIQTEIVFNCPRRLEVVPRNLLRPTLSQFGVSADSFIILFQGWIGPTRCIEEIIQSISHWPNNAHLVLIGPVEFEYQKKLEILATKMGVSDRLTFLGRIPYQDLFCYTVGADVALSLISDRNQRIFNWKFSAGAINKRFEYMACGVPQIANRAAGMKALIEDTAAGLLVDPENVGEIAQAVCMLLNNPATRHRMAEAARFIHLERFNYEYQFEHVLTILESQLSEKNS